MLFKFDYELFHLSLIAHYITYPLGKLFVFSPFSSVDDFLDLFDEFFLKVGGYTA